MIKAKLECLERETSGTDIDCNHRNRDECSSSALTAEQRWRWKNERIIYTRYNSRNV